jgi:hypothetical protein
MELNTLGHLHRNEHWHLDLGRLPLWNTLSWEWELESAMA